MKRIAFLGEGGFGMGIRSREMLRQIASLGTSVIEVSKISRSQRVKHLLVNSALRLKQRVFEGQSARSSQLSNDFRTIEIDKRILSKTEALQESVGAIHAEGSHMGHISRVVAERTGLPYVLDLHGLWGEECVGECGQDYSEKADYLTKIERLAVCHADHTIVVSNRMRDYIVSNYGASPRKVTVVPNGGFVSDHLAYYSPRMTLVYGGAFSYWERVEDYVRMAHLRKSRELGFLLLGGGPRKDDILRNIREKKPPNLKYLGAKPRKHALKVFSRSQIGVAPSTTDLVRQVAWPIKIMDYMSCGLPVIAPRVGDWGEFIHESGAGIATASGEPEELVDAALALRDKSTWHRASKNAVTVIRDHYTWDKLLEPLESIYSSLI
ncbi:MAG: glycosyltransferase family 4 protein [Thermoplasmata archaeon]|nr:glycosyltransferase family 4 protein [Thermoplasmata archaeon]